MQPPEEFSPKSPPRCPGEKEPGNILILRRLGEIPSRSRAIGRTMRYPADHMARLVLTCPPDRRLNGGPVRGGKEVIEMFDILAEVDDATKTQTEALAQGGSFCATIAVGFVVICGYVRVGLEDR